MNRKELLTHVKEIFVTAFGYRHRVTLRDCDIATLMNPEEPLHTDVQKAMDLAAEDFPTLPNFAIALHDVEDLEDYALISEGILAVTVEGSPVNLLTVEISYPDYEADLDVRVCAAEITDEALAKVCMAVQQHMAAVCAIMSAKNSATRRLEKAMEAEAEAAAAKAATAALSDEEKAAETADEAAQIAEDKKAQSLALSDLILAA